jgi:hypothetical protein
MIKFFRLLTRDTPGCKGERTHRDSLRLSRTVIPDGVAYPSWDRCAKFMVCVNGMLNPTRSGGHPG